MVIQNGPTPVPSDVVRGIVCMLFSALLFSTMNALVKWSAGSYPVLEILFFRGLFGLIPAFIFISISGGIVSIRTRQPFAHIVRAFFGMAAVSCFFLSYTLMPLADAVAITFSVPLFITVLSKRLLREEIEKRFWYAVMIGFIGVLIIICPGLGSLTVGALIALGGSFLNSLAHLMIRRLSWSESSAAIVFYFTITTTAVSGVFLPFLWITPTLSEIPYLVAIGIIGGTGQCFLVQAYRYGRAAVVAPFDYTEILWAVLFGIWFWGDTPTPLVILGAVLIVAAGFYILRRGK